jgi:hypothetical protein
MPDSPRVLRTLLERDVAVLVAGTLHPKPVDRSLRRDQIVPAQILLDGHWHTLSLLDRCGETGINSMARIGGELGWVYSTGDAVLRFDPRAGRVETVAATGLDDVHDLTLVGDQLHLANTGKDEVVTLKVPTWREVQRLRLGDVQPKPRGRHLGQMSAERVVHTHDRFHVNQVFRHLDGDLWAVVHNIDGKQVLVQKLGEVLKAHGNGGVLNLRTHRPVPLQLSSPHTIRNVDGDYVLFDSGSGHGRVYSPEWTELRRFPTSGWGRGADLTVDGDVMVVGISPIRKRYAGRIPVVTHEGPSIEVLSTGSWESAGTVAVPSIEEIYSVVVISRGEAVELLDASTRRLDDITGLRPAPDARPEPTAVGD